MRGRGEGVSTYQPDIKYKLTWVIAKMKIFGERKMGRKVSRRS